MTNLMQYAVQLSATRLRVLIVFLALALAMTLFAGARPAWADVAAVAPAQVAAAQAEQPAASANELIAEHWYRLLMSDQPAGYMHLEQQRDAETGNLISTSKVDMTIRRGTLAMNMVVTTRWVETPEGRPVETSVVREGAGGATVEQGLRFEDDGIMLTSRQQERSFEKKLEKSGKEILGPVAQEQLLLKHIGTPGAELSYWTYDLSLGTVPLEMKSTVGPPANVDVLGQMRQAITVQSHMTIMPHVRSDQWVTRDGTLLRIVTQMMPGLTMELIQAPRELATSDIRPPELMVRSLIRADRSIAGPRTLKRATYRLTLEKAEGDEAAIDLGPFERMPNTAAQRVTADDAQLNAVIVTVDVDGKQPEGDEPGDDAKGSSVMIDGSDEAVVALVREALGDDREPTLANAKKLEAYVADHIEAKDLSIGMASASEVARMKQGDCTEHAVLLAAMLRTIGIPSRAACGLAYVDWFIGQRNVFGFHMWTQGYVDGRWVDLDAAMPGTGFDATHITLAVDELATPNADATSLAIMPLIGRLKIEVIETK